MPHTKHKKPPGNTVPVSLKKEMAKPRMTKSARLAQLTLDAGRISEPPSITLPGNVDQIILPSPLHEVEVAQVSIEGSDPAYRALRIENELTDERGDEVKLKTGAHVEITVTLPPAKKS